MKNFKKLTAAVAATLMAATMVAPMAFAADGDAPADGETNGPEITTPADGETNGTEITTPNDGETDDGDVDVKKPQNIKLALPDGLPKGAKIASVTAYEVFKVKYVNEATTVTGWGEDVDSAAILAALKLPADTTADAVAKKLTSTGEGKIDAVDFAKLVMTNTKSAGKIGTTADDGTISFGDLSDGYYATSCTVQIGDDESYNAKSLGMLAILEGVATDVGNKGKAKVGLPKVQKKVYEDVKAADEAEPLGVDTDKQWNDVADYDIGDSVPFKLYGTMPDNLDMYEKYFYEFNDSLGKEFTIDKVITNYTVKIDETAIEVGLDKDCMVVVDKDNNTIKVTFGDIKTAANNAGVALTNKSIVTVEYNAILSSAANVGTPGQRNEVYLTYSNNPNLTGEGDWDNEKNKGKTPKDEVIVYTYALRIDKDFFESSGSKLADWEVEEGTFNKVEFKLYDKDGNVIKFKKLTGDNNYDYVVDVEGEEKLNLTLIGEGENGELVVRIKGLDDGTYTLKETDGPSGYNLAPDQKIVIKAETNEEQNWSDGEEKLTKFEWSVDEGATWTPATDATAKAVVENRKGTALPTTGGVGTRLFYFFGGAMVAIAGVSLITKKRMGKNQIL